MGIKLLEGSLRPGGLKITEKLVRNCGFTREAKILDIGCGAGLTVEYLTTNYGLRVTGIDKDFFHIEEVKKRIPSLNVQKAQGESLPFENTVFDGIFAECSLSVMDYSSEVLREINRVLKPGGKFAISDLYLKDSFSNEPNQQNTTPNTCLKGARTYGEIQKILRDHGFRLIIWQDASEYLKTFVAQYIMTYDSLDKSWLIYDKICQGGSSKKDIGYFYLIAKKC